MIPNQWYAVLESAEVQPGKPVGVTRMGEKLVFWRNTHDQVNCLRELCPHRGAALSLGAVEGDCIACPFHGFQFDATGQCRLVPANGKNAPFPKQLKAGHYRTYEADGFIFIFWGEASGELSPPRYFDNLTGLASATVRVIWKAHYSRAIENQLDVAHLPFVHHDTIGRGGRTVVDGPYFEWDGQDKFYLIAINRLDDGTPPRRPEELTKPDSSFWLEFIYPNLWQNHLGSQARVVVAFAPIDGEHTLMYLRFYQGFLKLPVLDRLAARLAMPYNLRILRQDQRVVETQLPARSELKLGEKLIQADRPIIAYRRRRQELIEAAKNPPVAA
jgi:phenylpropionate dioxygenase-like ring-hydroxylating dioxygenase large terminal subunit